MSSQYKFENHLEEIKPQSKVKLTDLLNRINQEKNRCKYPLCNSGTIYDLL